MGYSKTDILGKLNIGHLFLFSVQNVEKIGLEKGYRLLDIGAGGGEVTLKFKNFYPEMVATELS
jgi:ubiquinone/menaquinone biosynthesis C-methylase UbiE